MATFAPSLCSTEPEKCRCKFDPSGKTPTSPENPSIPHHKNIPLYRNSELRYLSRHPDPRRGTIVRRNERGSGCGGRGSVGHAKAGPGRDEPREVLLRADERRQRLAKPFG